MILYEKYKERRNKCQISKKGCVRKVAQLKKMDLMPFTIREKLLMIWQLFLWAALKIIEAMPSILYTS